MRQERRFGIGSVIGVCLAICFWCAPAPVAAAICTYTGPAGGSWTTAANWSCGLVPGGTDEVFIGDGADVTLGTPVTVQALTITGTGIRRGNGVITVSGAFTWTGGDLLGGGQIIVAPTGSMVITTPGSTMAHQVINRSANAQIIGAQTGGNVSGAFVNEGTVSVSGEVLIAPTVFNAASGIINASNTVGGQVRGLERLTNNGIVNVSSGVLQVGANNTVDSGDWNVAPGATLVFTMINGLTFPTRTSSGDVTVNGGTVRFERGMVTFNGATSTATFTGTSPVLDITGGNAVFKNVVVAPGTRLEQTGQNFFQEVTGTMTNQGSIRATVPAESLSDAAVFTTSFGLTGVNMNFVNKAALTQMAVERVDSDPPNADAFTGTGKHWIVTPSGGAFNAEVILPHAISPASLASVCRYTGSGTTWNCVATSSTATTVARTGITSGGTFAVGNNAPAPPPEPEPTIFTRYLAEGATGSFFDTTIALLNPTTEVAETTLTFLKQDGAVVTHSLTLPGLTRATVNPETLAGLEGESIATVIEATQPIVADRTMKWDSTGYGSHAETSIASPLTKWYLAEGATTGRFNLYYLIQNPSSTQDAQIEIRYLLPAPAVPVVKTYTVPKNSRQSIYVNGEAPALEEAEISAVVTSTNAVPVIVERAMYFDANNQLFGAGHASAAQANPSTSWFFAEGATGPFFNMFLLIANPNGDAAQIEAKYLLASGQVETRNYVVDANSRFTIGVHAEGPELAQAAVSTTLTSKNGVPVLAERTMWWPSLSIAAEWQEAHNSAGATQTGVKWALADGEDGGASSTQTYVLIANTSDTAGQARVTVHFEDGTAAQLANPVPLGPHSRTTVQIGAEIPQAANRRFGIIVESIGASPAQIVVERAMYSNAVIAGGPVVWAAGTNVVGTLLDTGVSNGSVREQR